MTVEDLLARLEGVRRTSRGWLARCPAHEDRHPSLSIRKGEDGRILLHCFAGCSTESICSAVGLRLADLFPDSALVACSGQRQPRTTKRSDWQRVSADVLFHGESLWLRAQPVLEAARNLKTESWTGTDEDAGLDAVAQAYRDLDRAELLADLAFSVRGKGLTQERKDHASRRAAA